MARHYWELVAWQRADVLRREIWAVVMRTPAMDLKFKAQWTDAARSACANIAEGFARRSHKDFAHFLTVASGSLNELHDQVGEAQLRGYVTVAECLELQSLVRRAAAPTRRLRQWLLDHPDPPRS